MKYCEDCERIIKWCPGEFVSECENCEHVWDLRDGKCSCLINCPCEVKR